MPSAFLSKSKFLCGLQCPKYLWILVHRPELVPPPDPATQARFDEGYVIDRLAKERHPDGIALASGDFMKNIADTQAALTAGRPLFEAGFMAENLSARADILVPFGRGRWDLCEVKSATEVKDVHVADVAFQRFCYEKAGLRIRSCSLVHVNSGYVRRGDLAPDELLESENITERVAEMLPALPEAVGGLLQTLAQKDCPVVDIGSQCSDPYDCPLIGHCWAFLPEHNVFTLCRGGKKSLALYKSGILSLANIPAETKLTDRQAIQQECVITGKPHVDRQTIREFLSALSHPLSFLDFETFASVIPRYDFVSPYQNIPFQFSLHVQSAPGALPDHRMFLASGRDDPRPAFLSALQSALPETGSVLVYNQGFEKGILAALAKVFPDAAGWIEGAVGRFVDLYKPFGDFSWYHPAQKGSASLKSVLPALTGRGYEGFAIADGQAASRAFAYLAFGGPDGAPRPETEAAAIRRDLERYCGRDTEGMVWIVEELTRQR